MQVLIYISLTAEAKFNYEIPLLTWAKQQGFKDFYTFDFDNHSDKWLPDKAVNILDEAKQGIICLDIAGDFSKSKNQQPGGVLKFLKQLVQKKPANFFLVVNGEHALIDKITNAFPSPQYKKNVNTIEIKSIITARMDRGYEG